MAATIGKVSAVFTASTSGLKAGVQDAGAAFRRLAGDVTGLSAGMRTLVAIQGAQLFGQLVGAASRAANSLRAMARGEADVIDTTSKLARRLGLTYGELAGMAHAGDLAGVSMDVIGMAATRADVAFVRAANGSHQAQAALAAVGLSVDQLQNKTPAERFRMMADAIAALPTPAERAAAAVALFGRGGAALLPLFEGGAGAIQRATEEAERFGLALTDSQGQAVEEMNDSFTRAYAAVRGVTQQVVAYLAPAIQTVTDAFSNLVGDMGGATIGQMIGDGIMAGAEFLATIADAFVSALSQVWEYVSAVGVQWSDTFGFGNRVAAFFYGVGHTIRFVLGAVILGLTATTTALLKGVNYLAASQGYDLGLGNFLAGADAFNETIAAGMQESVGAAASNFATAFGGQETGVPVAQQGPFATLMADARAAARAAAGARDEAPKTKVKAGGATDIGGVGDLSREQIKATDSRSKEGIAEMFRLLRGGGEDVAHQQLAALERIADNTSDAGDVEEAMAIP